MHKDGTMKTTICHLHVAVFVVLLASVVNFNTPTEAQAHDEDSACLIKRDQRRDAGPQQRGDAKPHQYSFIVRIQITGLTTRRVLNCTGTIVDEHRILTTASCVKPCISENYKIEILVGLYNLDKPKVKLRINHNQFTMKVPREFKRCQPQFDLCLIAVEPEVDLAPYAMDDFYIHVGPYRKDAMIVGWNGKNVLQEKSTHVMPQLVCDHYLTNTRPIMDERAFFGCSRLRNNEAICPSDNGAPLLIYSERWKQYSIVGVLTLSPHIFGMTDASCPLENRAKYLVHTVPQYDFDDEPQTSERPSLPPSQRPSTTRGPRPTRPTEEPDMPTEEPDRPTEEPDYPTESPDDEETTKRPRPTRRTTRRPTRRPTRRTTRKPTRRPWWPTTAEPDYPTAEPDYPTEWPDYDETTRWPKPWPPDLSGLQ